MLLSDRILYVVEFNEVEGRITRQVAAFANACHADVVLLSEVAKPYQLWRLPTFSREKVKRKLERTIVNLRAAGVNVAGTLTAAGNMAEEAMRVAGEQQVEFIMVGAGAASGRDVHHTSALALSLARSAQQHVWICKPEAEPALEHVLCAVDTSRGSAEGLRVASDICRQFNARLRTVSVLKPPKSWSVMGMPELEKEEDMESARERMLYDRKTFLAGFNLEGISLARSFIWADKASTAILTAAENYPDGLSVIGVAGARRFYRPRLGTTADRILRKNPSSLLVVK